MDCRNSRFTVRPIDCLVTSCVYSPTNIATAGSPVPLFGKVIRPALLKIRISGFNIYSIFTSWIRECINRLPSPNRISQLKLYISQISIRSEVLYPQLSDYETILHILQQLLSYGTLECIDLTIVITSESYTRPVWDAGDQAREASKLLAVLTPLLEAKILHARLVFQRRSGMDFKVLWSWSEPYFIVSSKCVLTDPV